MRPITRAAAHRWASAPALVLAALLVALVAAAPVAAADPITMSARGLLGGRFTTGEWAAIAVSLANDGPPVTGTLAAQSDSGTVERAVELPAGSRKEVTLYLRPAAFTRELPITFTSTAGSVTATATLSGLDRSQTTIALVGDDDAALRTQLTSRDQLTPRAPFNVVPADLPERPEPLRGLGVIVWADDSSALTEGQRRTLERWVAAGGELIVVGGPDWQARTAAFGNLLPVTDLVAVDGVDPAGLAALAGSLPDEVTALTVATGALADGARSLVPLAEDDARPLIASAPRGAGRVVWIGADLAASDFAGWDDGGAVWARLVPDNVAGQFFGGTAPEDQAAAMTQALTNLPALEVPPAELLLILIVAYILLIGPVSYVLLRRVDRRELAWVTAPLLVVLFSACSYGIGTSLKGSQVIVNQVSVVRSVEQGTAASVTTWAGIFSPARTTYDLSVAGDALIAPVELPGTPVGALTTEQGDPAHLRDLAVNAFGLKAIRADTVVAHEPPLEVSWRLTDHRISGTVTNVSDAPLADVAVLTSTSGRLVGDLAPGASAEFDMAVADFTGSSPADQVYGFARGDTTTDAARTRSVRRQVLTGLVGYGGGGMPVSSFSAGPDVGPWVVGWHETSLSDVLIDGQDVQRFNQSVEVIAGRPTIDAAAVEVRAVDVSSRVVGTDGQVDRPDPMSVIIGEGSATFELTLPLEVAGIRPSEIVIWAAPDPGSVIMEQPMGGGMFPPGYTIEIMDPRDGSWSRLGDLALNSRFTVREPAGLLSPGGAITVRVSATDVDRDNGKFGIYVSASVTGTLP